MTEQRDTYEIVWERKATKGQRDIDRPALKRIIEAVEALADNPRPPQAKALTGPLTGKTRIAVGIHYRVLYVIDDQARRITIEAIGSREDIY